VQQENQKVRRIRRSEDEKCRLLDSWKKSGVSARAFGIREGVRPTCLWRWKRAAAESALAREAKPQQSISFAPVHVTKSAPPSLTKFERVQAEVVLGRDLSVRVFEGADVSQVCRLIHALTKGAAC
jgi:hypothetical protein